MFCKNCGKELNEGAKFCAGCGTSVDTEEVVAEEVVAETPESVPQPAPVEPEKDSGRKRPGKGVVIAAAVVAVIAIVVGLIAGGAFTPAKAKVGLALLKSAKAYTEAIEKTGLTDALGVLESQKYSQSVGLTIADFDDSSVLEGFGLKAKVDANLPGQKLGVTGSVHYGATDLGSLQLAAEGSKFYLGSPELLGEGAFYGVDTSTLGADLADLVGADEVEDLSFNVFELIEILQENLQPDKESKKAAEQAVKDLVKAISVEKTGKESVSVNGSSVKCTAYQVVIPQDAMEDFLDAAIELSESTDYEALMLELIMAMGFEEGDAEDLLDEMGYYAEDVDLGYAQDAIEDVLDMVGDIEVTVYVKGKYAMAVVYENKIEGVKIEGGLYMGGGKNFADDLSVVGEVKNDYYKATFELVSTGNHTGSGGTFTDETTFKVKEDGETYFNLTSEMSYSPKGKDKNFTWSVSEKEELDFGFEAEGHVSASSKGLSVDLSELSVEEWGEELFCVELQYELTSFNMGVKVSKPVMLNGMDEDDLEDLGEDIMDNVETWGEDVMDLLEDELSDEVLEELQWMLYYMF